MHTPFTPEDIRAILTNPVYTGIEPFQAIVGEETWLDVNVAIIAEKGTPEAIQCMVAQFEGSFPDAPNLDAGAYVRQASIAPRDALRHLVAGWRNRELRDADALRGPIT